MIRKTRPISWIKGARKDFEKFPEEVQTICLTALTIAAENGKADIAKPFKGLGSGIFEIALPLARRRFPCRLRRADRQRDLGSSRIPEEIDAGHQDAAARSRID